MEYNWNENLNNDYIFSLSPKKKKSKAEYKLFDRNLIVTENQKDLLCVSGNLKISEEQAMKILDILNACKTKLKQVIYFYNAFDRPHLEYCAQNLLKILKD